MRTVLGRVVGDVYPTHDISQAYSQLDEIHTADVWYRAKVDAQVGTPLTDTNYWIVTWTRPDTGIVYPAYDATRDYARGDEVHTSTVWYKAVIDAPAGSDLANTAIWSVIWTNPLGSAIYPEHSDTIEYTTGDEIHTNNEWYRAIQNVPTSIVLTDTAYWEVTWTRLNVGVIYPAYDAAQTYNEGDEIHTSTIWYRALRDVPTGINPGSTTYWVVVWTNPLGTAIYPEHDPALEYTMNDEIHTADNWYRARQNVPPNTALTNATYWNWTWKRPYTGITYPAYDASRTYKHGDEIHTSRAWYRASQDVPINTQVSETAYWDEIWTNPLGTAIYPEHDDALEYTMHDEIHLSDTWYRAIQDVPAGIVITHTAYWEVTWNRPVVPTIYPAHDISRAYIKDDEIHTDTRWYRAIMDVPANTQITNTSYWGVIWTHPATPNVYPSYDPAQTYNLGDEVHTPYAWYRAKADGIVNTPLTDEAAWDNFWTGTPPSLDGTSVLQAITDMGNTDTSLFVNAQGGLSKPAGGTGGTGAPGHDQMFHHVMGVRVNWSTRTFPPGEMVQIPIELSGQLSPEIRAGALQNWDTSITVNIMGYTPSDVGLDRPFNPALMVSAATIEQPTPPSAGDDPTLVLVSVFNPTSIEQRSVSDTIGGSHVVSIQIFHSTRFSLGPI